MSGLVKLLRPQQWLKNLMLFFPPFLGGVLKQPGILGEGVVPFAAFCLASSFTYVLNDMVDRERDRLHPRKRYRPLASGEVSLLTARVLAVVLLTVAVGLALTVSKLFLAWLVAYTVLSVAYSFYLKHQPLLDIFAIASGFVFRLFAGGAVFGIVISDWLFLSVLLLALYLSAGKRLAEMETLGEVSGDHRRSLDGYPEGVLDGVMYISGAAVLVTYTMYVIVRHKLVYTVPLCCFGLFRYLMLAKKGEGGDPMDSLLKDPVMFMVGLAWVVIVGVTYYGG